MHTHYGLKSPSIMLQWEQKDLLDRFIKVTCTATCTNKRSGMRSHYFMSLPLSGCPPLFPNVACVLIQHKGHWLYFVLCFYMYMYRFLSAMFILISSLCTVPSRIVKSAERMINVNYNAEARLADTTVLSPVMRRQMSAANSHPVWIRRNRFYNTR